VSKSIARVVFNRPVDKAFHYAVPEALRERLAAGMRVRAPFGRGNQTAIGYCVGLVDESDYPNLKSVQSIVDAEALVDEPMLELTRWMAEYYACSWGQVLEAVVPAGVKKQSGTRVVQLLVAKPDICSDVIEKLPAKQAGALKLLMQSSRPLSVRELASAAGCSLGPVEALKRRELVDVVEQRLEDFGDVAPAPQRQEPFTPNEDQAAALKTVLGLIDKGGFQPALLYGVTGSGKTEVYLQAIERVVGQGREAVVLVPEISLTPQTIQRFRSRFDHVAVLHSHLTDVERHYHWRRIAAGEAQVVIGARSAIFAPARRLGLIVIDEEHETSFKQDTVPRYHARDVAVKRAALEGIPIILGSATPSLESWQNARAGRYALLELPRRVADRPMPKVTLVDMREQGRSGSPFGVLSRPLAVAMHDALEAGGQVILFLNRRGFHTYVHCPLCGFVLRCHHCDIGLVYYRRRKMAVCHYCDYQTPAPEACPACNGRKLRYQGLGTERLEQEIAAQFPDHPTVRMDSDTMRAPGSHERSLSAFRKGEVPILLGTQMIAKGLDFPNVTLVGVINADTALAIPDFRAAERTFQLVAQVAGRTGRSQRGGRVIVQTFNPEHPSIIAAASHDFVGYADGELPARKEHGYPPFGRLARIIFRGRDAQGTGAFAGEVADRIRTNIKQSGQPASLLGPAPAPVGQIKGKHRFHLLVTGRTRGAVTAALAGLADEVQPPAGIQFAIDVDPINML